MRSSSVFLLGCAGVIVVACANGETIDLAPTDGADSGTTVISPTETHPDAGVQDSSVGREEEEEDAADGATVDSGMNEKDSGEKDSGTTTVGGDCTGTQSSQVVGSYDTLCDNFFFNTFDSLPCSPGMNECAVHDQNPDNITFCCFTPPPGSLCYADYFGQPQCLPR